VLSFPTHLPLVAFIVGAVLGACFGFCLGLELLERERALNNRRRAAIRRHAVTRGDRLGGTTTTTKELEQ
jgi:hypothetical protein